MGDCPKTFATSLLVPEPPTPPVPLSGIFDEATGELQLLFDKDLVPRVLDERQWQLFADAGEWETTGAEVEATDPTIVVATFTRIDPAPPQDTITYTAAIPDLVGQNGLDVVAFTDFPITVV